MPASPERPRSVMEIDWPFFGELCRALALKVARAYEPDLVLGIAKAGVIPGVVIASILQRDFASIVVTRHTDGAAPSLLTEPPEFTRGRRVLIVDETCESGDTLRLALEAVEAREPVDVRTAVSFKTGDYEPDFHALATDSYIVLPWDRVVLEDGALVTRPEYERWLSAE